MGRPQRTPYRRCSVLMLWPIMHGSMDVDDDYWESRPDPSDDEITAVCRAWLSYEREKHDGGVDEDDPCWWAVEAVMEAEDDGPLLWRLIRRLCSMAEPEDPAVDMIGVGPLETMVWREGDRAMDLIEPAADADPVLQRALAKVWMFDEPVRPRIDRYLASRGMTRP
jgi:hypothetical protein